MPRRRPGASPATEGGRASALGATAARRAAASGAATSASDEPHARAIDDGSAAPDASPEVVGLAFFGAVAVLEAIAWFFVVRDNPSSAGSAFQVGVAQATEALTVLAPPLWVAAVVAALRGMRVGRRMVVLAAGAVVLFPWPWVVTR
ncbi:putative integral membrane protein [Clavibacter sepedonicus]|uniref:Integral membrane protein n=1 Tax=Clavibacter sepedonicus TaxID=31964 RepID=B0RIN7_CLASE|nr:putative integral membrane protein [Clavibacter sepedonicus]